MNSHNLKHREAGILLPIFSLPDEYGIGTLGKYAYKFIDFLKKSNQHYWQILPIGPTSYGDSPYQSFSSFAGNPYFIDLEMLVNDKILNYDDIEPLRDESLWINYERLYNTRFTILKKAFNNFDQDLMKSFCKENKQWLDDYALFMSLKNFHNGKSFLEWDDNYKFRDKTTLKEYQTNNQEDIDFWKFIQYEFFKQWELLKQYANENGIKIIGDIPIYTALDSADVWANKKFFKLDKNFNPTVVAGCPPDAFSPNGQLWGNPIYDWDYLKKHEYSFWVERIKQNKKLFDIIRIDHFRGFEAYYTIKFGAIDGSVGTWEKGPNVDLFNTLEAKLGHLDIIAENLGFLTKEVDKMINKLGYPGMKILQFGFEPGVDTDSISYNLTPNTVVYPGTHDNMPIRTWFDELDSVHKQYVKDYLSFREDWDAVNQINNTALRSNCKLAVIALWDYLNKDKSARINTPSTLGGNWCWRMEKNDMNDDFSSYINHLMKVFNRNN